MRTYVTKVIEETQEELTSIVCNQCNKYLDLNFGEVEIKIYHQFGSNCDGELHEIDLCNSCYNEWINWLWIKPTVFKSDEEF